MTHPPQEPRLFYDVACAGCYGAGPGGPLGCGCHHHSRTIFLSSWGKKNDIDDIDVVDVVDVVYLIDVVVVDDDGDGDDDDDDGDGDDDDDDDYDTNATC